MKKILLLIASAFVSANLVAQTTNVVVKLQQPDGSPAGDVSVMSRKAKVSTTTNADGIAKLPVADKDELVITDPKFYEVSVAIKKWNPADTINIPMTPVEGAADGDERLVSQNTGKFNKYGNIYDAIKGVCPLVSVYGECIVSNRTSNNEECALIVVDGKPGASLSDVNLSEVSEIEFLQTNQAAMYGTRAKYGALVVTTIGSTNKPLHK